MSKPSIIVLCVLFFVSRAPNSMLDATHEIQHRTSNTGYMMISHWDKIFQKLQRNFTIPFKQVPDRVAWLDNRLAAPEEFVQYNLELQAYIRMFGYQNTLADLRTRISDVIQHNMKMIENIRDSAPKPDETIFRCLTVEITVNDTMKNCSKVLSNLTMTDSTANLNNDLCSYYRQKFDNIYLDVSSSVISSAITQLGILKQRNNLCNTALRPEINPETIENAKNCVHDIEIVAMKILNKVGDLMTRKYGVRSILSTSMPYFDCCDIENSDIEIETFPGSEAIIKCINRKVESQKGAADNNVFSTEGPLEMPSYTK